jgi:pimeloyl-ACP methyl ester carboxylesterase
MSGDFDDPQGLVHHRISIGDVDLHVAEAGAGRPILLLHGWPEFWATWLPLMNRLCGRYRLIAPDLRGFGTSDKAGAPRSDVGAAAHGRDMAALIRTMDLSDLTVVGHDVGGYAAQSLAQDHPALVDRLFFFNCPTVSVGNRWIRDGQLNEVWYQSFHQLDLASALVGTSRETCRIYFRHFLTHWAYRKDAFEPVLERWVDNFMQPGALQGGFDWYRSQNAGRLAVIEGRAQIPPPIEHPTGVYWGRHDPILRSEWAEFVPRHFTRAEVEIAEGAGHFVHVETPDEAAARLDAFIQRWPKA